MTLTFYMKSGNSFSIDAKSYEIKNQGNTIISIALDQEKSETLPRKPRLLVKTIDLSQIEAITET